MTDCLGVIGTCRGCGNPVLEYLCNLPLSDCECVGGEESRNWDYWDEYDEDGDATGNACTYDPENSEVPENWRLCFSLGGDFLDEGFVIDDDEPRKNNFYWINAEEFWNTFPEPQSNY